VSRRLRRSGMCDDLLGSEDGLGRKRLVAFFCRLSYRFYDIVKSV